MPELDLGLVDGGKLNFDLSCSLMQRKKYMRRVPLDLTLNDEY